MAESENNILDQLYDELFYDEQGTLIYRDFVVSHQRGSTLLELACGSGDLLYLLRPFFKEITGIDLSAVMVSRAHEKRLESVHQADMINYRDKVYDMTLCVGDSLNYLLDYEDVRRFVNNTAKLTRNRFILDFHSQTRLAEFSQGYREEGRTSQGDYVWEVMSEGCYLLHQFRFFQQRRVIDQQVIQRIYTLDEILDCFDQDVWEVTQYPGLDEEGTEKILLTADKKEQ